jgi:hypothetical protein
MKNRMTILCLLATLFILDCAAQPQFGVKAGVNFASLSNFEGSGRCTAHAGIYLHNKINNTWSIQPEIIFSGEGATYNVEGESKTLALHFISVPIMFQFYASRNIIMEAGPQFSIMTDAQSKGGGEHLNVKRSFRNEEFGLSGGLVVQCSPNLAVYGRYNANFTDVTRYDGEINQSRVISVGIAYRLKKISF